MLSKAALQYKQAIMRYSDFSEKHQFIQVIPLFKHPITITRNEAETSFGSILRLAIALPPTSTKNFSRYLLPLS